MNNEEEDYNPDKWSEPYIEGSHNCYAYFLDTIFDDLRKNVALYVEKIVISVQKKLNNVED